jgi:hypothetical protein
LLCGTVETKRNTARARLLTLATPAVMIAFGAAPDGLAGLDVEIAIVSPVEQLVLCVNPWIWL